MFELTSCHDGGEHYDCNNKIVGGWEAINQ